MVKGRVKCIDNKTNKILFEKDNIITNNGKKYVMSKLLGKDFEENGEVYELTKWSLGGTDNSLTQAESGLQITKPDYIDLRNIINKSNYSNETGVAYFDLNIKNAGDILQENENYGTITFTLQVNDGGGDGLVWGENNTDSFYVNELGLFLKATESEDYLLFSRIAIEPIMINNNTKLTLEYKIYI